MNSNDDISLLRGLIVLVYLFTLIQQTLVDMAEILVMSQI